MIDEPLEPLTIAFAIAIIHSNRFCDSSVRWNWTGPFRGSDFRRVQRSSSSTWTSRRPECFGCHELLIRLCQQACEQPAPCTLALVVGNQVLADFDCNVMQAASLTMPRDRVIRRIGHAV